MNEHNKGLWLYSFSIIFVIFGIFLFANNLQAASITDPMTITVDISADNAIVGDGEDISFSVTITPAAGNDIVNATIFFKVGETDFNADLTGSDPYTHTLTVTDSMANGALSFVKISISISDSDNTATKEKRSYTESDGVTTTLSPATISIDTIEEITDPGSITLDISTTRSDTDVRIGESINFAANIVDTTEGIATGVDLLYQIASGSQQVLSLSDNSTHWINSLDVDSSTSSGDFTFVSLSITLRNADNDDTATRLFNTGTLLTLNSPDTITINPTEIESVTDPTSIEVSITSDETDLRNGDTIAFSVAITDAMNGKATDVTLTYTIDTTDSMIALTRQSDGTWTNTLTVAGSTVDGTLSFASITVGLENGDGSASITSTYVMSDSTVTTVTDDDITILSTDRVTDPTSVEVSITSDETALRNDDTIVFRADISNATHGKAKSVTLTYSIDGTDSPITLTNLGNDTWTATLAIVDSTADGSLTFVNIIIELENGDGMDTDTRTYVMSDSTVTTVSVGTITILSTDRVTDPTSVDVSITSDETALRNDDTIVFRADISNATHGKAKSVTLTYSIDGTDSPITLTNLGNDTWTATLTIVGSTAEGSLTFVNIIIELENGDGMDTDTRTYVMSDSTVTTVSVGTITILSTDRVTDPTSVDVSITADESNLRNDDSIVFRADISNATNGKATSVILTYSIGGTDSTITLMNQENGTWSNTLTIIASTADGTLTFVDISIGLANGDGLETDTRTYVMSDSTVSIVTVDSITILSVDRVTDPTSVDVSITADESNLRNDDTIVFRADISNATNGKATSVILTYSIGGTDSTITLMNQENGTWSNTLTIAGSTDDGTLTFVDISIGLENEDGMDTDTRTYVMSDSTVSIVTLDSITILSVDRVTDPTSVDVSISADESNLRNDDTIVFRADISNATNGKATSVILTYSIGGTDSTITLMNQENGTWSNTLTIAGSTDDGTLTFVDISIGLENGDGMDTDTRTYVMSNTLVTVDVDSIEILSVDGVTDPEAINITITSDESNLRIGDTIVFTVAITDATNGKATSVTIGYILNGSSATSITLTDPDDDGTWSNTLTIMGSTDDGMLSFSRITIGLQNGDGLDTDSRHYEMDDDIVTVTVDSITILSVDRVTDPTSVGVSITAGSTTLENDDIITFSATIADTQNGNTMSVIVTYNIGGTELTITLTDPDDDGTWSNTLTVDANTPNDKLTFVDIIIELQNAAGDDTNTRTYVESDDIVSVTVGDITIRQIEEITALNEFSLSIRGDSSPVYLNEDISFIAEVNESEQGKVVSIVVNYQIGTSNLSIELTKLMNGTWSATHVVSNDTFEGKLSFVNMSLTVQNAAGSDSSTTVYDLDSNGTNSFYFFVDTLFVVPKHRVTDPQSLVFNITSSNSNENIAQEGDEITIKLVITDSTNGIVTKAIITYMIGDDPTQFEESLTEVSENTFVFVFTVTEDTLLGELVLVSVLVRANNSDGSLSERKTYVLSESEISTIHGSITVNAIEEPVKSSTPPGTTNSTKGTDSSTVESTSSTTDPDFVLPVSLTPMLVFLVALGTVISIYALKRRSR